MTQLNDQQRQAILADPSGAYLKWKPSADEAPPTLITLQQQHTDLRAQLKSAQQQSKKLSRQIGEARSKHAPTEQLLAEMQQQSAQVKQLKNKLSETRQQILAYFETDAAEEHQNNTKRYQNNAPATDNLSIDLHHHQQDAAWNQYVNAHPAASIYHLIEWKNLIGEVFGHQAYYFMATDSGGTVHGILPLIRLNSRLFGDFMVSMPYFNYGGAIADTPEIEQQLIDTANKQAEELGLSHIEYRDDISRSGMPARTDKVNMILPLPDDDAVLWQGFNAKLRAQIRRAQRESHQVLTGGHNCLQEFYTVFARNMRDLGTPVYSRRFFEQILQTFPQQSKIVVIRLGQRPVAAAFLLAHGERMEIPWASTIRDVNHLSINMMLYWEVLKLATRSGCRFFDFGRSSKDAGTYRFKQQWGAQPQPCYWHYWLPDGAEPPKLNPDNPKYALAIRLWQQLPVWASKLLGPPIVRNLP